jgi:hypothetical protein
MYSCDPRDWLNPFRIKRSDRLTVLGFIGYFLYDSNFKKPDNISQQRWLGMLKWRQAREKEGFDLDSMYKEELE